MQVKAEAKEKVAAKVALWSFLGLLIDLMVSVFAGKMGDAAAYKITNNKVLIEGIGW